MRDISTISVEEGAQLWESVMPKAYCPFKGQAYKFKSNEKAPDRVVFQSGVERLGIYLNGHIWADSDLIPIDLDKNKIKDYLHSINISYP